MARHVLSLFTLIILVLLSSCSAGGPMVSVLQGNLAYGRGEYQVALVHYLSAQESVSDRGWLLFNSANVYYALGEQDAALAAWNDARQAVSSSEDPSTEQGGTTLLIHAASYNRGVLLFQRGDYREAYDEFRYALSVNAKSSAAKANLELALQKIRSAEQVEQIGEETAGEGPGDDTDDASVRILEYVRRKEAQRWYANRESDDATDSRDW